jgi:DNA polymerase-3 subunit beta
MNITCTQEHLAKALSIASHAVSPRSTLPILANVKIECDVLTQTLAISATNLEIGITYRVPASVKEEGATTIPAKTFIDLVNSLRKGNVEIIQEGESPEIQIKTKGSRATIKGMEPSEFPALPNDTEYNEPILINGATLKDIIAKVAFAAADDNARPVLTGVLVEVSGEEISFAAADAFRLALRTVPLPGNTVTLGNILIPAQALMKLMSILPTDETVKITATPNKSMVAFQTERLYMVSRLIEGAFPNIRAAIPKMADMTEAKVSQKELAAAIKSVMPFARDSSNIVKVKIQKDEGYGDTTMTLISNAEDVGGNEVTIPIEITGKDHDREYIDEEIIFNAKYMSDVMPVLPETITLAIMSAARPGLITYPPSTDDGSYQYVIMPMSVNR